MTKVKPNLWDKGSYFVENLLRTGALRLTVHFKSTQNWPYYRVAPVHDPVGASVHNLPHSQAAAVPKPVDASVHDLPQSQAVPVPEPVGALVHGHPVAPLPEPVDASASNLSHKQPVPVSEPAVTFRYPQKRAATSLEPVTASVHDHRQAKKMKLDHSGDPQGVDGALSDFDAQTPTKKGGASRYDRPAALQTTASTKLPKQANYAAWAAEFLQLVKTYLEPQLEATDLTDSDTRRPNRYAHKALINGQYGISAPVPCNECTKHGLECRVYHPDCYKWEMPGRSTSGDLGWRCSACRLSSECKFPDTPR